jgi:hypothetical protein
MLYSVAQIVEAQHYKPEGQGFHSRCGYWNISLTYSFRPRYGCEVDSASNINKHHEFSLGGKDGRCVVMTTLPPSRDDFLEILEVLTSWIS